MSYAFLKWSIGITKAKYTTTIKTTNIIICIKMGTKCIVVSSDVNGKCKCFDKNKNNLLVSGFTILEITSLKTLDIARPSDKPIATFTGSCTSKNFKRFKNVGDIFPNNASVSFNASIVLLTANIIILKKIL
jgi:hypothetical protein